MRKATLAIITISLIAAIIFVVMGRYSGEHATGDKRASKDKGISVSKATTEASTVFAWEFETWQPENLHWDAPSSLNISDNGDWYAFASRLENQRRSGGFFDTGHNFDYNITVTFYPEVNCGGASLYGFTIHLDALDYKDVHTNVSRRGNDPNIQAIVDRANCARAQREFD